MGHVYSHDTLIPVYIAWNSFLSDPKGRSSVFQLAHNTPNELYEWMKHHPDQGAAFHTYMNHQLDSLPGWLDAINFLDEFAQNTSANTPLFVDVGGGKGQQCAGLLTKYPNLKGRVILQDLSSVIQDAVTDSRVERMSYDFFTEQPVKRTIRHAILDLEYV
jgi:demethylsterigmatocystin 6-O-methyltransferase